MKTFRLSLATVFASLALVACDYRDETAGTTAPPQASLPEDTVLNAPATASASGPAAEQPGAPVDATPAPVQPITSAGAPAPAAPPAASADAGTPALPPDTSAMGAQPGTSAPTGAPPVSAGAATPVDPAAANPDGVAAPTELARFLEETANTAAAKGADQPSAKSAGEAGKRKAS